MSVNVIGYLIYFIMAFFIILAVMPFVISYVSVSLSLLIAHAAGILDRPNGGLKNHEQPTAYLGGVGIFIATILSYWILSTGLITLPKTVTWPYFLGLLVLVLVGLVDDIFSISPLQKLLGQIGACGFFVYAGLFFREATLAYFLPAVLCVPEIMTVLGIILSVWWMLSIINAMNLLDIMDGLATIITLVAFSGMGILMGGPWIEFVLPFASVLLAFFLFNKPRASIYLGDAGSLFLGGLLATTPFLFGWGTAHTWGALLAPILILFIPIVELCSLIIIRTYLGIPFYYGSPHHFALYLKRRGWTIKMILIVTGTVGVFFSLCASLVVF